MCVSVHQQENEGLHKTAVTLCWVTRVVSEGIRTVWLLGHSRVRMETGPMTGGPVVWEWIRS